MMPMQQRNENPPHIETPAVEIWDLHSHISGLPGRTPDERMVQLIKYADRMGIARLCVYMGMNLSFDPTPEDFRKQNDEVLQALSHWHHRAFGFVYVNPNHVKESLAESDPTAGLTEMAVRELGAERVIYGSDVPGRSFASQLAKVQGADIPEAAKRLILGGNLKRLLLPILKAKGVRL